MEHEVYVPFSASTVRGAFDDPERVAGCLPGFQPGQESALRDARLRVRVGGSTITYRGDLQVSERGEGLVVEAEAAESRGSGTVRLTLSVVARPDPTGTGTTLVFTGAVEATGRLAGVEPEQRDAAARRLLDRFSDALAEGLAEELGAAEPPPSMEAPPGTLEPGGGIGAPDDNKPAIPGIPAPETGAEPGTPSAPSQESDFRHGHPDPEIPSPTLDPRADLESELDAELESELDGSPLEGEAAEDEPFGDQLADDLTGDLARPGAPAEPEADVARRTMIGRSAEEVDHAPPRGRYAPRPAPGRAPATAAVLRWAAPVAALAVASAVVVGRRVLRRRR
ncbi:SRPBCC domain-containing protein [Streptomyces sp. B6B3]|uniref:SRPBCC domain-containing protein n=1 Tax=Streptomyces sp. B6B3 TaxID=3153570 RepID=UPI00325DDCA7